MLTFRPSAERGHTKTEWLDSRHTFSFAEYNDPRHMGFRSLRVINDDRVAPGGGFPTHPHREMEIVSLVLEGKLAHKDSLGQQTTIVPWAVQRTTAGTGILHSEFNASQQEPVHFYQIWIKPAREGLEPSYQDQVFQRPGHGQWLTIVSADGLDGSALIHQDVRLLLGRADSDRPLFWNLAEGRYGWLQVIEGQGGFGDLKLQPGDGVAIQDEREGLIRTTDEITVLFFDLN